MFDANYEVQAADKPGKPDHPQADDQWDTLGEELQVKYLGSAGKPTTRRRKTEGKHQYTVTDSGKKSSYADGVQRDTTEGKPKFTLMFPEGVPFEEQLITRVAMHYMLGGVKYGDRGWEQSSTEESLNHHKESLFRHFVKFLLGVEDGEDHAAAVVWNVNAVDLTRRNIRNKGAE